jgi:outer membrane lipoprotein-sorting protein
LSFEVGRGVVAALLAIVLFGMLSACGGSDPSGQDVAKKVQDTISQPGMVYHAVEDDGTEVWIDAADQKYRKLESPKSSGLVSIGDGWKQIYYDPFANQVGTKDLSPKGPATPRINNPAASWNDALGALAFGAQLDLTTKSSADGVEVWVLQAKTPILDKGGNQAGQLAGRIEVDTKTNLPHAFEKHEEVNGVTPTPDLAGLNPNRRIVYKTSEMIARDSLPADFFDDTVVTQQVQSPEQNMEKVRALGLEPLWLGVHYVGPGGILQLPSDSGVFPVSSEKRAEIHYSLIIPVSATNAQEEADSVVINISKDISTFKPPTLPQIGGDLPEQLDAAHVNGGPAVLYTSTLTPNDLPCDSGTCPPSDTPLYRRLIFSVGDTAVQITASARIGSSGKDSNGYNDKDAIVALAEAMSAAPPLGTPTPTPAPGPVS